MNTFSSSPQTFPSDGDLLEAWVSDQHSPALSELVRRYSRMVLSVCRRRCRNQNDADDAYQTTFLYLATEASNIRDPDRLAGWLYRVAQRAAVATLVRQHEQVESMAVALEIPDDPLERLTIRHNAIVLDEELADLPDHYRSAIVLHICEGVTVADLADQFGTTPGAIRGRLQRGRRLLSRRLRRRGVVPIVAFASSSAWTVTVDQSLAAATDWSGTIADGVWPRPVIDIAEIDSRLQPRGSSMSPFSSTASLLGGAAVIATLLVATGTHGQSKERPNETTRLITLPPAETQTHATFQAAVEPSDEFGSVDNAAKEASPPNSRRRTLREPESAVAKNVRALLDKAAPETMTLRSLMNTPDLPVFIDERALTEAKVDVELDQIEFTGPAMPLRSALRKMLSPHGLKATVDDDGLVVTADFAELAHQGLPMSRWVDSDQKSKEKLEQTLQQKTSQQFNDTPLEKVIQVLSEMHKIPMILDERALEEIGLSTDELITVAAKGVSLRSLLRMMLDELDLTYSLEDEVLVITTIEKAEQNLLHRIYWLEGTGMSADNHHDLIRTIEASVLPETWESLGGPSVIQPLPTKRPAILVSSVIYAHEQIERLLKILREANVGVDR